MFTMTFPFVEITLNNNNNNNNNKRNRTNDKHGTYTMHTNFESTGRSK